MQRISTGVKGLDKLIEGGFPVPSAILFIGVPGTGKTTFSHQFIYKGLEKKNPAIYTTFDIGPSEIAESMSIFSWDLGRFKDLFVCIDCYSWKTGKTSKDHIIFIKDPANLNDINIAITSAKEKIYKGGIIRYVIDSVSSLLMNTNPQMAFKFLEIVNAKIREFGGIGVWILEEGIHDEQTVNTLKYLCDSVMEFKLEGNKRYIRIARMRGTRHEADWYEFRITDEGLEVRK